MRKRKIYSAPSRIGVRELAPSGISFCELAPSGIGFRELAPPGIGFRELAPPGISVREQAPSGIGFCELAPSGIGFRELAPPGIGFRELAPSPPSGIGFRDLAPSGIGFCELAPSGIGFCELAPPGIGFCELAPSGIGVREQYPSGIGFRELAPSGIGFRELAPYGIGFCELAPPGIGFCELAPSGIGVREQYPSGIGFRELAPSGIGVREQYPSGIGFRELAPSGIGVREQYPSGIGFRELAPSGIGFRELAPSGINFRELAPSGIGFRELAPSGIGFCELAHLTPVLLTILVTIGATSTAGNLAYKRVCYFTNWAQYRGSPATYTAADIDAHLCTHIIFAFAQMSGNNLATYEWNDEAQYAEVMGKKTENPDLKVMLAVGGYNHGVSTFSSMVSSLSNIEEFATNVILFLRQRGFDGLDLDWEYPAHRGSPAGDREKFTQLTMVLRQEFDKEGSSTSRPALLLSAAVSASRETVDTAYEIDLVSQYVDFINLMAYDFHGTWDTTAGHNSPLYERSGESGKELDKNQNAGVQLWLSNGTPAEKLVLGLALYGRSFTLASSFDTSMGSAVVGGGVMGAYTTEAGYLGYFEICDRIENGGWTKMWHNEHQVPFAYSGNQWVGFDDVQSFGIKAEYIKSLGLGGSMVWAMDLDDFNNICGLGANPMMNVLKTVLESPSIASTMMSQQSITTSQETTPKTTTSNNALTTLPSSGNLAYKRVCYFTNWAQYRGSPATYTAADIDAHLCTHIIFAFAQMSGNNLATYEWNDEAQYAEVMGKKTENPDLKVMLAVGGYNHGVSTFSSMVSSLSNIEEFATNVILFLRQRGFDGLDLDWEYPAHRGSPAGDREKFTQLTMVLRQEFDKEGSSTSRPALLLSAAVSASRETVDTAYEIDLVSQYVDFINLMAYDFHGTWDTTAGHNSPLYERSGESGKELDKNQNAGVQLWLSNGTPAEKLVLGLALYGRSFTLASSFDTSMGSAVVGGGVMGAYTTEAGYLGYFEICDRIENGGWTKMWHNEHQVPFAYSGNQWVGFDDVQSFGIKAEYIKSLGLGGSMVWAMDLDDFNNICGLGANPMMNVLKTVLESPSIASTMMSQQSITTSQETTPKTTTSNNALTTLPSSGNLAYKRVCYFTNWAQYRGSPATYTAADIDAHLCTHIIFAFAQMSGNNLATYEWNDEAQYAEVMGKKTENPDLKVMLAVGGYNHGVSTFSSMVSSLSNIEEFATNVILFLRQRGFDGLDLDWEYPAHRGSPAGDREKFTQLTMVLRQEFDKEGSSTSRPALLLSAAVSASRETVDTAYEIDLVSQYVDFINLMAYDFHGTWDTTAGHNSPLYERSGESGKELDKNQNAGVQLWLSNGTPAEKLVLGLALYGRSFTLASSFDTSMGSAVVGGGVMGAYTTEAGYLGYFEICDRIENGGWTKMWHNEHQVPFAYSGNQWVGFDDVQSFGIKAEYIKSLGLGGSMVWAMDLDDFNNICGLGANPMMNVLKTVLESPSIASTMMSQQSITTSQETTPKTTTSNNALTTLPSSGNLAYKRVCYFTNWAQYRGSPATYTAADIDAHLCTHIIFAFAQMSGNNLATYEWNDEAQYAEVMGKKTENPDLKVMLAVGGYNHGVSTFSSMVSSLSNIEEFATNVILFLRQRGFDGLDLDWEYPAHRGSPAGDREKFTQLTMVLRQEFDKEGSSTSRPALLLSAAVSASRETVDTAYEIDLVSQYVDFINLMAYDFHGTWDATAGHNSPLYERSGESGKELDKNQNAGVQLWLSNGTPAEKLVLGLALYGRSFTLASSFDTSMGSAVVGGGVMGAYTTEAGYLGYFEICDRIENGGWTKMWHNEHQVPFAYSGNQWVGFDDVQSFGIKAEYIKSLGLGGSMVWAMDLDDFNNICGLGANPMMNVLKTVLESPSIASTMMSQQSITTSQETTPKTTTSNNALTTLPSSGNLAYKRVCYFTNWAQYRGSPATYIAADIDAHLCTHIIFAFAQMSGNNLATYEWNDEAQYAEVMGKKTENPDLKVMLAVGGYNHGVSTFSSMVSSLSNIEEFATNVILFLRQRGFDGLDLDWEYPAHRGSPAGDREKFTQLTMVLRQEFDKEGSSTSRPALLLSAAVSASRETVDTAYEIDLVSQYVDFINLMAYDFHGTWDATAGHNSPLYERSGESGKELDKNQNAGVQLWLSNGTPAEKLVLGLALYGRSFTLASSFDTSMGSAVVGGGVMGAYTTEAGYLGYFEICDRIENGGWTKMWHNEHQVPFAYSGNQWVGFDDVQSFGIKAEYIKTLGLGGSMVWAMDLDDHKNICGLGANPMMNVLKTAFESPLTSSMISQQPTSSTQTISTATLIPSDGMPSSSVPLSSPRSSTLLPTTILPTSAPFSSMRPTTAGEDTPTNSTPINVSATILLTTNEPDSTSSKNNCEPPVCPNGQVLPSLCDASCVYQCCSGGNIRHCCQSGYTWNDTIQSCQMTVPAATTSSNNIPNCDAPSSCSHGKFIADECDPQCYYNCAHDTAYHYCCSAGTLWDDFIKDCNYPHLIQYDPACHHSTCPPYEFLPDPCVPECYYQCSSTGVDFRYCCSAGQLWDESIKNCNYPAAMPSTVVSQTTVTDQITTSSQYGGQLARTVIFHPIIFTGCSVQVTEQTSEIHTKAMTSSTGEPITEATKSTDQPVISSSRPDTITPITSSQDASSKIVTLSTSTLTTSPTSARTTCEPAVCPDGQVLPSQCDSSCVYQCCNGENIQHCCQSGYTWNDTTQNCQMTVPATTTSSNSIPNCDAPLSCTHGEFLADECDLQCYYNCAHGTAYHYCCVAGSLWDDFIKDCNFPHLIQYDPACHHDVCPPYEFLPDPCVPNCYYQCSSTGVDFRYCCSQGLLWDESIKNCNYPEAILSITAEVDRASSSLQHDGQQSGTIISHDIIFSNCNNYSTPQIMSTGTSPATIPLSSKPLPLSSATAISSTPFSTATSPTTVTSSSATKQEISTHSFMPLFTSSATLTGATSSTMESLAFTSITPEVVSRSTKMTPSASSTTHTAVTSSTTVVPSDGSTVQLSSSSSATVAQPATSATPTAISSWTKIELSTAQITASSSATTAPSANPTTPETVFSSAPVVPSVSSTHEAVISATPVWSSDRTTLRTTTYSSATVSQTAILATPAAYSSSEKVALSDISTAGITSSSSAAMATFTTPAAVSSSTTVELSGSSIARIAPSSSATITTSTTPAAVSSSTTVELSDSSTAHITSSSSATVSQPAAFTTPAAVSSSATVELSDSSTAHIASSSLATVSQPATSATSAAVSSSTTVEMSDSSAARISSSSSTSVAKTATSISPAASSSSTTVELSGSSIARITPSSSATIATSTTPAAVSSSKTVELSDSSTAPISSSSSTSMAKPATSTTPAAVSSSKTVELSDSSTAPISSSSSTSVAKPATTTTPAALSGSSIARITSSSSATIATSTTPAASSNTLVSSTCTTGLCDTDSFGNNSGSTIGLLNGVFALWLFVLAATLFLWRQ
ncbi:uncharacterized protein LOC132562873 [Ylistrum balloti]|uniref:uncharacterized protein LOC132562873 n=1 Tax=Ylistrum balloti TaxID=509963 RepID=UPI002905AAA0|nr:uncharacterized protein LOC132562873 [Ylistrum balloti]